VVWRDVIELGTGGRRRRWDEERQLVRSVPGHGDEQHAFTSGVCASAGVVWGSGRASAACALIRRRE